MNEADRKIIHVDMDAFYASVEQRDDPALRERPVAVGGSPAGRGVVAAASYEARVHGVRSAVPAARARRLCPDLVFVRPRFDVYRRVSGEVRAILDDYSDRIEPLSLDEAYLDVTGSRHCDGSATRIAREIRERIRAELALTASAGVSCNKFLAKLASDQDKPDGLFVIRPEEREAFVATLAVRRFHGIGPATAARMQAAGIETGDDLRQRSMAALVERFGKAGERYYWLARGIDDRPVAARRVRKSVGQENTFDTDLRERDAMVAELVRLADRVADRLVARGLSARTVTVKVRFSDFSTVTRAWTAPVALASPADFRPLLGPLLDRALPAGGAVRLLGVTASNLAEAGAAQAPLWE
jgi:DNA polymerase-4